MITKGEIRKIAKEMIPVDVEFRIINRSDWKKRFPLHYGALVNVKDRIIYFKYPIIISVKHRQRFGEVNKEFVRHVIKHELAHIKQYEEGRFHKGDGNITWNRDEAERNFQNNHLEKECER